MARLYGCQKRLINYTVVACYQHYIDIEDSGENDSSWHEITP